jgi:predicted AlkP superfamily phosphohydrolase/phosphomutase
MRVAIIGFDSLDPSLVKHWSQTGQLPTFQKLFSNSAWSYVTNPRGFEAGTCWMSMWTGVLPDEHGIHDGFYVFDPHEYRVRIVRPDEIPEPFWMAASRSGRRLLVIDIPYTFLSPGINGVQVCDWLVHVRSDNERIHCHPATLAGQIARDYGLNPWFTANRCPINEQDASSVEGLSGIVDTLTSRIALKTRFCRDMLARAPWELFFTVFHEGHDVGHMCWHGHDPSHERHDPKLTARVGDPLLRVYQKLDAAAAALLDALPPDAAVLVYSSHGIGPEHTASRFLDAILARLDANPHPAKSRSLVDRLAPLYRRVVPAPVRRRIAPSVLGNQAYQWAAFDRLRRRRYFALNPSYATGGVRFNIKGRDGHGVVEPGAELERLMREVADGFREMRNADSGEPLVEEITATSDLYKGSMRYLLPDLLLEWNKSHPIERVSSPKIGEVNNDVVSVRSGDHATSKQGLLFAPVAAGSTGQQPAVHVIDIAPTLLNLLGVSDGLLAGKAIPFLLPGPAARSPHAVETGR